MLCAGQNGFIGTRFEKKTTQKQKRQPKQLEALVTANILELKQMQAYVEQLNKSRTGFLRQQEAFKQNPVNAVVMNKSLQNMIDTLAIELVMIEIKMIELVSQHHQKLFEQLNSILAPVFTKVKQTV